MFPASAYRAWSSTTTTFFSWSASLILTEHIKTSWTIYMFVAGVLIVGRYPTLSWGNSTSLPNVVVVVHPLTLCPPHACSHAKTQRGFFLLVISRVSWQATSKNLLGGGGLECSPALWIGRFSASSASKLLFSVLTICIYGSGGRPGLKCLACTAIPFTLGDVPSPDNVFLGQSMLSMPK